MIRDVPHIRQKPDFCGEAVVASYLQRLGYTVDQDFVYDQSGLDPALGRGCYTRELAVAIKNIGFVPGPVWYTIDPRDAERQVGAQFRELVNDLARDVPSIVCMYYNDRPNTTEHFRLILGYDATKDEVLYHEPAEDGGAYRRMARTMFLKLWPLRGDPRQWCVIRMPLRQGRMATNMAAVTEGFTSADYAQHVLALKPKVPEGFVILIEKPFVIVSDQPIEIVQRQAEHTVRWCVSRLKSQYFKRDPMDILDIWLFKNATSYYKNTKEIFGRDPGTPYGYFSSQDNALVMNIATGGGTLVHEIVHPFVAANFPYCPAWLNEGLGSLYEQSSSRGEKIVGLTNWRLAGLQKAIKAKRVPSFKTLLSTTDNQFYGADPGTNYAQARYLCYYLQEKGLLEKFYHDFHANHREDPTGYGTLCKTLGVKEDEMARFQRDWEAWVMRLTFP